MTIRDLENKTAIARLEKQQNKLTTQPTHTPAVPYTIHEELLKALKMQINWHMRDGSPCACPAGEGESDYKGKMPKLHSTACVALREAIARAEGRS